MLSYSLRWTHMSFRSSTMSAISLPEDGSVLLREGN
jgi:hypothetical protein